MNTSKQLNILASSPFSENGLPSFKKTLKSCGFESLRPSKIKIFQINVGKLCNQACRHCHVDAGPNRKEIMNLKTVEKCLEVYSKHKFPIVDITGGAPEMNPHFRFLVTELKNRGAREIIVRCNLTIILAEPKYFDLPDFFKENDIHVISSLPFYQADRTNRQRGNGVFEKSIEALNRLNAVGYGIQGSNLKLDLVYNPCGAFLPGDQKSLEKEFKNELFSKFGISFNSLLCITNLPISRYLEYLIQSGNFEDYMKLLVNAFNPSTVLNLMCRDTISIGYDGTLYDCDFNQMLNLPITNNVPVSINEFDLLSLESREIRTHQHCYGCTAGSGSSCQGAVSNG